MALLVRRRECFNFLAARAKSVLKSALAPRSGHYRSKTAAKSLGHFENDVNLSKFKHRCAVLRSFANDLDDLSKVVADINTTASTQLFRFIGCTAFDLPRGVGTGCLPKHLTRE